MTSSRLYSVDANRDAVDERERLRVFREHGSKISRERHVRAHEHAIAAGHRQPHAFSVEVAQPDGKAASFHLGFEVENPKGFHVVRGDCVFIVDDTDVRKPSSEWTIHLLGTTC